MSEGRENEKKPDLVVIGSSAGGIEALTTLFAALTADFPAPIVVAQHLDPMRPSSLASVLERRSGIPIKLVEAMSLETRGDLLARTANGWGTRSGLAAATQGTVEFPFLSAAIFEVVIAAVFVGVILAVTKKPPSVVIGFTLTALHIISWPATNTSFNPARSLASVIFSGNGDAWGQLWLFLVAPLVGAGLAALFALVFSPVAAAPVDVEVDDVDETYEESYEIVPEAETAVPAVAVAPVEDAAAAPAEPVEAVEAASDVPVEPAADDVAAPEGSTPEKPKD